MNNWIIVTLRRSEMITLSILLVLLLRGVTAAGSPGISDSDTQQCSLRNVSDCFETCYERNVGFNQSKLSDENKTNLLKFLKLIKSLGSDKESLQRLPHTSSLIEVVFDVFTKLTDHNQSLSIKDEMTVIAATEEALAVLAGTLDLGECEEFEYEMNYAYLCHDTSRSIVKEYDFGKSGTSEHFQETLSFDLDEKDADVTLVVLRKKKKLSRSVTQPEWTGDLLASNMTSFKLNSAVLAFSLFVGGNRTSVPVNFSLHHLDEANDEAISIQGGRAITRQPICAFWDTLDENEPNWSSKGCQLGPDESTSNSHCICNHSTSFAVILQVTSNDDDPNLMALELLTKIGFGTSIAGLLCTLFVYGYLRGKLQSDRIFMHTNLSIAILAAQILFLAGIDRTENKMVCMVIALLLHFFFLSIFGWMLVEGVHLYMKVIRVYGSENIKMYRYVLLGWVTPAVICSISCGANHTGYGTARSCWLDTESGMIWAFAVPVLLVVTMNLFVLSKVIYIVTQSAKLHQNNNHDHIKAGVKGAIVLLPILGVTWVFGLMNSTTIVFQYLFTGLNSFQGLFIFLIHCVFNTEVKAALSHKRSQHDQMLGIDSSRDNTKSVGQSTYTRGRTDLDGSEECTELSLASSSGTSSGRKDSGALIKRNPGKHQMRPMSGKVVPAQSDEQNDLQDF